ncbi:phosphotransferase family protein [Alkalihalobacillus sp. R86527]|uniref:phosphotransferase family protein n=1 Tax=Alkalihalobacillus sp. R86527 TaxID=3093863 RepID=UPI00366BFB34
MYILYKIKGLVKKGEYVDVIKRNVYKLISNFTEREMQKFNSLLESHRYSEAVEVGKKMVINKRNDSAFLKKMAFCSFYAERYKDARNYMESCLVLNTGRNVNEIVDIVSNNIFSSLERVKSNYIYLGGHSNLGFIEHNYTDEAGISYIFITKIVCDKNTNRINREQFFYSEICREFPQLTHVAPKAIGFSNISNNGITLLTYEKISGHKPNNSNLTEILKINNIIETISYEKAKKFIDKKLLNNDKYVARLVHKKIINMEIFSEINHVLKRTNGSEETSLLINRLKNAIFEKKLYKKLNPAIHYSFCHNDFHKNNILASHDYINKSYVFDWNNYSIALKGWDMAYYFGNFEFTFNEILEKYIVTSLQYENNEDESIARIFFVFILIYIWIHRLRGVSSKDKNSQYFRPAIEFVEELVDTL